ncbi:hypothetical protein EJ05DRAFT_506251 [Pseudovirgaria hyperparasitica]|uniref:WAP domain-containing protein n=1 Tax=Pseudovirgaria hyperparasitica TaxID=470096 RepID=A0A6A6WIA0_9PEZI|nr:uncharacterized protein EJ05DRAFT_506251 [Pseudovirgaria hyperparasitica]KAF2762532.1 hypothetical protein EJ05DRAFT_506251 [Pseudovirgaria hyperparasitica]
MVHLLSFPLFSLAILPLISAEFVEVSVKYRTGNYPQAQGEPHNAALDGTSYQSDGLQTILVDTQLNCYKPWEPCPDVMKDCCGNDEFNPPKWICGTNPKCKSGQNCCYKA